MCSYIELLLCHRPRKQWGQMTIDFTKLPNSRVGINLSSMRLLSSSNQHSPSQRNDHIKKNQSSPTGSAEKWAFFSMNKESHYPGVHGCHLGISGRKACKTGANNEKVKQRKLEKLGLDPTIAAEEQYMA